MKDAIIILAGGVNYDGTLPSNPKLRVEKGVELYNQGKAKKIIMSGAYGFWLDWLKKAPPIHEAEAMKTYALSLGVPNENVLMEEDSKDTLGNAYFVKVSILEKNNWKNIIVVTSDYHLPRAKIIFDTVLGPDYTIEYVESKNIFTEEEKQVWKESEAKTIEVSNKIINIDIIKPGDTEAIKNILFIIHPGYAKTPTVSFEELEKMLGRNAR